MKAICLFISGLVLLGSCQTASEKQIGLGETTQHDDFFYSARQVERADSLGPLKPKGRFWVVTFRVDNKAKRVEHPWTNATALVADENGRVYENQPEAQQQLNRIAPFGWQEKYITPAGRIDSTRLVFDLPTSVQKPYLQFRGETLMGDVFDGSQFEHTKVRLF